MARISLGANERINFGHVTRSGGNAVPGLHAMLSEMALACIVHLSRATCSGLSRRYTPTGNGLGLDSSGLTPVRQRSKRPWSRLMRPVYQ